MEGERAKEEGARVKAAVRDIRDIVTRVGYKGIRRGNQHVNFIRARMDGVGFY